MFLLLLLFLLLFLIRESSQKAEEDRAWRNVRSWKVAQWIGCSAIVVVQIQVKVINTIVEYEERFAIDDHKVKVGAVFSN